MICLSVVSHGQREIAIGFLRSLATCRPGLVAQVVYTSNLPEQELSDLDLGHIHLITLRNAAPKGFGQNHNAAFKYCDQPYFAVVNPDIILQSDPFPALLSCLEGLGMGLTAPVVTSPSLTVENTSRKLYTPMELVRQKIAPANFGEQGDWLAGMFLLFRSQAFRTINGFDESYFLYIEDVEICSRLRLAGWRLRQCTAAQVIHDARKASHRSLRYTIWHINGMIRYWRSPSFWKFRRLLKAQARMRPGEDAPP
jgi:GT2 family glycosyltransferase